MLSKSQPRWLPLHIWSQLVVEMTLGDVDDAMTGTALDWELRDVALLGTCLHVDSSVTSEYHRHIDMGNKLTIPYTSVVSTRHIVNSSEFSISLSRSLSRLKQIYFVLVSNAGNKIPAIDHEQRVAADTMANDTLSLQFQVGSAKFPDNPCEGVAEAYYRLQQAVGVATNHENMSISPAKFMNNEAVFGIDFERAGDE